METGSVSGWYIRTCEIEQFWQYISDNLVESTTVVSLSKSQFPLVFWGSDKGVYRTEEFGPASFTVKLRIFSEGLIVH